MLKSYVLINSASIPALVGAVMPLMLSVATLNTFVPCGLGVEACRYGELYFSEFES